MRDRPQPVIPGLAIQAAAQEMLRQYETEYAAGRLSPEDFEVDAEEILAAAAPAIVAANQPEPSDDLRTAIKGALWNVSGLPDWYAKAALGRDFTPLVDRVAPAVEAFVAAQTAAARADVQACVGAVLDRWGRALREPASAPAYSGGAILADIRRAFGVEGDHA